MVLKSDKDYWHRYLPEYERLVFKYLSSPKHILEFGVLDGDSIRFLKEKFPTANIVGIDNWAQFDKWPQSKKINYIIADQEDKTAISQVFNTLPGPYDLIIDDGSHVPEHQASCLVLSLPHIRSGGYYIVEDIHTAFQSTSKPSIFNTLLTIAHHKEIDKKLSDNTKQQLLSRSISIASIEFLEKTIDTLQLIQRTSLPLRCYSCGKDEFNYLHLICNCCGVQLFSRNDSMSFIIRKA